MDVCLLWVLCVVRYRSLRRADHGSRGVLPTVVPSCVWSRNLVHEEAPAPLGAVAPKKKSQCVPWGHRRRWSCGRPSNSSSCLSRHCHIVYYLFSATCCSWSQPSSGILSECFEDILHAVPTFLLTVGSQVIWHKIVSKMMFKLWYI
jgi:hypothetical protein